MNSCETTFPDLSHGQYSFTLCRKKQIHGHSATRLELLVIKTACDDNKYYNGCLEDLTRGFISNLVVFAYLRSLRKTPCGIRSWFP